MTQREQTTARPRELWQPDRREQMAAVEILLASPLPREARAVLRDLECQLRNPETMQ